MDYKSKTSFKYLQTGVHIVVNFILHCLPCLFQTHHICMAQENSRAREREYESV